MGIVNHNAILATTCIAEAFSKTREFVNSLPLLCLDKDLQFNPRQLFLFGNGVLNGFRTVILIPDGCKENTFESNYFDNLRTKFIQHLETPDENNCVNWNWIEVSFGEYGQQLLLGNNQNQYI